MVSQRALLAELSAPLLVAGIEDARRELLLLLAYCLRQPLALVLACMDQSIDSPIENEMRLLASRRRNREPLAYLTGTADFSGLELAVGPGVLVPRPDSEMIVETAVKAVLAELADKAEFGALEQSGEGSVIESPFRILDTCTGSGAIGIAIAYQLHQSGVAVFLHLIDISETALEYTRRNSDRWCQDMPVMIEAADLFPKAQSLFDLITANPPYIADSILPGLMPEVSIFEPKLALAGGSDGLDPYRRILERVKEFLKPDGLLILEHGYDQAEAVADLIRSQGGFTEPCLIMDYGGNPRVTTCQRSA